MNDLEMLSGYENSIAMGNGEEKAKNAAGFINLDNDSNGIILWIKQIFGYNIKFLPSGSQFSLRSRRELFVILQRK